MKTRYQEPVSKYRLKKGCKHAIQDETEESGLRLVKPGQVIELTKSQYEQFKDRFDPVSVSAEEVADEEEVVEDDEEEVVEDDEEEKPKKKGKRRR